MIIPPDPEKDPNIFSASSSTPSLLPASSEHSYYDGASSWGDGESLPPYDEQRRRSASSSIDGHLGIDSEMSAGMGRGGRMRVREGDVFSDLNAPPEMREVGRRSGLGVLIPSRADGNRPHHVGGGNLSPESTGSVTPTAGRFNGNVHNTHDSLPSFHSTGGIPVLTLDTSSRSPSSVTPGPTLNNPKSSSKLWESSAPFALASSSRVVKLRQWIDRWKKWIIVVVVLLLIGVALVVGLLIGLRHSRTTFTTVASTLPGEDNSGDNGNDGTGKTAVTSGWGGAVNLTYTDSRDGPTSTEGSLEYCNQFTTYNQSSPFSTLFTPFGSTSISTTTFTFPLQSNGSAPSNFFINTHGIGSSGTITFVGTEASTELKAGGEDDVVMVDVVVSYAGPQALSTMMRVCEMTRNDGGVGVGIYSPKQTDDGITNVAMLDPYYIPTSHIVIRVPPTVYSGKSPSVYFPSIQVTSDRMQVRLGKLNDVVEMGELAVDCVAGGLSAGHVNLKSGTIIGKRNDVRGKWNVSESLQLNVTDGSVVADIILHNDNPSTTDNGTTFSVSSPDYTILRRSSSSLSTITNKFYTSSGSIDVRYLHHPSTISLSSFVSTAHGRIGVRVHPTFVGPFSAKTVWGGVYLPTPSTMPQYDPKGLQRDRALTLGTITVDSDSMFAAAGMSTADLSNSTDTLTGVAYWANVDLDGNIMAKTVAEIQDVAGDEIVVVGGWGDVEMSFDGI